MKSTPNISDTFPIETTLNLSGNIHVLAMHMAVLFLIGITRTADTPD